MILNVLFSLTIEEIYSNNTQKDDDNQNSKNYTDYGASIWLLGGCLSSTIRWNNKQRISSIPGE